MKNIRKTSWLCVMGIGLTLQGCILPVNSKVVKTRGATDTAQVPVETVQEQHTRLVSPSKDDARYREVLIDWKLRSLAHDPEQLREFLLSMPKGADLHMHLAGSVSTERLVAWGAADRLCINQENWKAEPPPCQGKAVPMQEAMADRALHRKIVQEWSMEHFQGSIQEAQQHFWDALDKFEAVLSKKRLVDSLADVLSIAGKNTHSYVELLHGLNSDQVGKRAAKYIQPDDPWTETVLLKRRQQIMADPIFQKTVAHTTANLKKWVTGARDLLGCKTDNPDPGCAVEVRFLMSANRTRDRGYVFGQWVYGYELARQSPLVLGIGLMGPEEHENSLAYYDDEMFALDVLHRLKQADAQQQPVRIALPAGELIPELVPDTLEGQWHLEFHIRHAVEMGHAERVGHGCDVLGEEDHTELLASMRDRGVLIEACLTSNAVLLGKTGYSHPLNLYLTQGVPAVLATDHAGILRTDSTDEFVRAVTHQHLGYSELKRMVRASVEHSFLPGASLWQEEGRYERVVNACAQDRAGATHGSASCNRFLQGSRRAAMQWKLEGQLAAFEEQVGGQ